MENRQLLLVAGIIAIVALLLSNAVNLLSEYARTRYAQNFAHWLRVRLLRRMASQPYTYFLQRNSGDLLKKIMGDVTNYAGGVLLPLLDTVARVLTAVLLLATLFLVQPIIAISAAVILGGFYAVTFQLLTRKRREVDENLKIHVAGSYREAHQMLSGIKPVKVHRAEEHFLARFAGHSAIMARMYARTPVFANSARYFVEPLAFGGLVVAVLVLAARGRDFSDILPNLGVMALAGYRLLPSLQLLYAELTQVSSMRHAVDEVYDEFVAAETDKSVPRAISTEPVTPARPFPWDTAITLCDVSYRYPGVSRSAVEGLSVIIPKNSSLGVIGPTGSGKSTLVDLLLGLYLPTAGEILIDGQLLTHVPCALVAGFDRLCATRYFSHRRHCRTQYRVWSAGREIDSRACVRLAPWRRYSTSSKRNCLMALIRKLGERGIRLSGGQRQRIGLARALYHRPSLLILDEATSALDVATEAKLLEALRSLAGKLTMVVAAHRLSAVENCDQLVNLSEMTGAVKANYGLR